MQDEAENAKKLSRRDLFKWGAGAGAAAFLGAAVPGLSGADATKPAAAALPQVPRRRLGKTNVEIPILLLGGAMKFDPKLDPKLAEGLRFGCNYIDTADCYAGGTSETGVGSFASHAGRANVWITSKSDQHDVAGFQATLRQSLERLGTDHVDMYFLHMLTDGNYLSPEMEKTVEQLKKLGHIRHFGFSCHDANVAELLQRAAKTPWVDAVMFRYNFRQYGDKELNAAIDACAKADVGLIAMKTQGSEASFADAWQKFQQAGKWSKHQAVLKAVWADTRISAAVSHMDTFEKLKANIAAAVDKFELGQGEWDELQRYGAATRSLACDGCEHLCNAAVTAPVRIGTTMRYLMYHDVYGEPERARALFAKLPNEARQLRDVDFTAARAACPHDIDIGWHMQRAADVLTTPS
jgi:predicted aldo/keto reductase-like oxidoreductase